MTAEFAANIPSKLTDRKAKDPVKEVNRRKKMLLDLADVVDVRGMPGMGRTPWGFTDGGKYSIKKFEKVKFENWDWISPELRNHVEELLRPTRGEHSDYATIMGLPQKGGVYDSMKHARANYDDIKHLIEADIEDYNEFLDATALPYKELGPTKRAVFSEDELKREQWMTETMRLNNADIDEIISQLRPLQEGIGGAITKVSLGALPVARLMRVMKAGLDLGVMMIHGFNALTRMPLRVEEGSLIFDSAI